MLRCIELFECEAQRPNAGGRKIQLWLNYDQNIYTGDSDHPDILSHYVNTSLFQGTCD